MMIDRDIHADPAPDPVGAAADDRALASGLPGLTADSRQVGPGWLFAALEGRSVDGHTFIPAAIGAGAAVILARPGTALPEGADGVRLITDREPRCRFARLAAAHFGRQPSVIAAVTGTNGKTSTVQFVRQLWQAEGRAAASLGTLGVVAPGLALSGTLTTPDPMVLHAVLADLVETGVTHAALEASSHGLDQCRLDGMDVAIAAFTQLSRDHLDYHGSEQAYWQAKRRLFDDVLAPDGVAVINADAPQAAELEAVAAARGQSVIMYGRAGRDVRIVETTPHLDGLSVRLTVQGRAFQVSLPLVGAFQAHNAACALAIALASGSEPAVAVPALESLTGVPGRLELAAKHPAGAPVFVDYAHTPDALESVLTALRPPVRRRLLVVFGCGGDRDRGKRPLMGQVVANAADAAIVTDDNPRTEDPAAIRAAVLAACPDAMEIGDRGEAIRAAVGMLGGGDVLVIAGKGHEQGQTVGTEVRPFDDVIEARRAMAELAGDPGR